MQIQRILEQQCHMTRMGGWGGARGVMHSADTVGLCQLGDDVMIYFEEVMSGFCSEAVRAAAMLGNIRRRMDVLHL